MCNINLTSLTAAEHESHRSSFCPVGKVLVTNASLMPSRLSPIQGWHIDLHQICLHLKTCGPVPSAGHRKGWTGSEPFLSRKSSSIFLRCRPQICLMIKSIWSLLDLHLIRKTINLLPAICCWKRLKPIATARPSNSKMTVYWSSLRMAEISSVDTTSLNEHIPWCKDAWGFDLYGTNFKHSYAVESGMSFDM